LPRRQRKLFKPDSHTTGAASGFSSNCPDLHTPILVIYFSFVNLLSYFLEGFAILVARAILYLEKAESRLKDTILQNPEGKNKWECYFRIYGCNGIICCWIKDGMEQTPEELASYITGLIK